MIIRSSVLSAFLLASCTAQDNVFPTMPACPGMTASIYNKYHEYDKCNHAWQTSEERRIERSGRHNYMKTSGSYPLIPNQRTVVCPTEPADLSSEVGVIGMDTRWVVENKSLGNVVVAYVENGVEYSAMNGNVTPPQADPEAILQPGEYKVINTFEGHVFYVREMMEDGSTGDILLQHRPGVVEFTNRFGNELDCGFATQQESGATVAEAATARSNADDVRLTNPGAETLSDSCHTHASTRALIDNGACSNNERDQSMELQQSINGQVNGQEIPIHQPSGHCNMIYQGFRNALPNCPLNIYFAGIGQGGSNGPMQRDETLRFHLGNKALHNAIDEEANLKFEVTFVGHTFVARLASNPDIVVDSFTLQPTEIHDCPRKRQKTGSAEPVIESDVVHSGHANLQNTTAQHMESLTTVLERSSFISTASSF